MAGWLADIGVQVPDTHKVVRPTHNNIEGKQMKALETVKLIEVTLVLSIETYGTQQMFCGMDYIVVQDEAQVLGWSERELEVRPKEGE